MKVPVLILGGGISGLSTSYHIGHHNCLIVDRNTYLGGHAHSYKKDQAFWDEGPHVSFTKNPYARQILTNSSSSHPSEFPSCVGNYFNGHWIPHPAQSHLRFIPADLAGNCLADLTANFNNSVSSKTVNNYQDWLDEAFGYTFSRTFPHAYTRKYWTCDPKDLAIDWVGERVYKPDLETVKSGLYGDPKQNTHYINSIRYPSHGGFVSFFDGLSTNANFLSSDVVHIDLSNKSVTLKSGEDICYDHLINSIPLDQFVYLLDDVPPHVHKAASQLRCSSLLLVNLLGTQSEAIPYQWLYVYDEEKYSTRITQTHLLSQNNTPSGLAGIQVEVYSSPYKPFQDDYASITSSVIEEVTQMKLLDHVESHHFHFVRYANIIFDHQRKEAQDAILSYLSGYGLQREHDDLSPMTDWNNPHTFTQLPDLSLAGRFGQWKYFWSDDCILRGHQLSGATKSIYSGVS